MRFTSIAPFVLATVSAAASFHVSAQISDGAIKLGVLNDQSGPLSAMSGPGTVVAVQMAVDDLKSKLGNIKVEVLVGDHQNKADLGSTITRRWFDVDKVDAILDVTNSAVGLAVQSLAREKNKVAMFAAVATTELTGKQCSKSGFAWLHDSYSLVAGPVKSLTKEGLNTWYFIAADYAFGKNMVSESKTALAAVGGKVLGESYHPIGNADYSSYLLQAQSSGAKVVAISNAGQQLVNVMKQWKEFGLQGGPQTPVAQLMLLSDVHGMGLDVARGLSAPTAWYWDLNEETRAFSRRFFERHKAMPTEIHASMYSATAHYLNAVIAAKTDATDPVVAKMRSTPVNDFYAKNALLREDGKLIHDFLLISVKSPAESKAPWDYYNVKRVIPATEVFAPLSQSECPLVAGAKAARK
jgi:branched-chain amino acid transport system substrate-binding protein